MITARGALLLMSQHANRIQNYLIFMKNLQGKMVVD